MNVNCTIFSFDLRRDLTARDLIDLKDYLALSLLMYDNLLKTHANIMLELVCAVMPNVEAFKNESNDEGARVYKIEIIAYGDNLEDFLLDPTDAHFNADILQQIFVDLFILNPTANMSGQSKDHPWSRFLYFENRPNIGVFDQISGTGYAPFDATTATLLLQDGKYDFESRELRKTCLIPDQTILQLLPTLDPTKYRIVTRTDVKQQNNKHLTLILKNNVQTKSYNKKLVVTNFKKQKQNNQDVNNKNLKQQIQQLIFSFEQLSLQLEDQFSTCNKQNLNIKLTRTIHPP